MKKTQKSNKKAALQSKKTKNIYIASICFVSVAIVVFSVLLVLDANGFLYKTQPKNTVIAPPNYTDSTEYISGIYSYIVLDDGSAMISSYNGEYGDEEVIIPSQIDGYKVTAIGNEAFSLAISLRKITIPEGVTYLGKNSFAFCGIDIIYFPSTLEQIDSNAFSGCEYLSNIYFSGTSQQYKSITISDGNQQLYRAITSYAD